MDLATINQWIPSPTDRQTLLDYVSVDAGACGASAMTEEEQHSFYQRMGEVYQAFLTPVNENDYQCPPTSPMMPALTPVNDVDILSLQSDT